MKRYPMASAKKSDRHRAECPIISMICYFVLIASLVVGWEGWKGEGVKR